jgi:hypothetical protein
METYEVTLRITVNDLTVAEIMDTSAITESVRKDFVTQELGWAAQSFDIYEVKGVKNVSDEIR